MNKPGLAYLKNEMASCERRIKKISENPDPSKPKSNILLYELERDLRQEQIEAYENGKPLGITGLGPLPRAMGMVPWDAIMAADRTHGKAATQYFAQVRKLGMPDHTCDRCSILVPMILNGDFPKPSFLFTSNFECKKFGAAWITDFVCVGIDIHRYSHSFRGRLRRRNRGSGLGGSKSPP